eukprot:14609773-Alexandrium_andersonii.AAC.1
MCIRDRYKQLVTIQEVASQLEEIWKCDSREDVQALKESLKHFPALRQLASAAKAAVGDIKARSKAYNQSLANEAKRNMERAR